MDLEKITQAILEGINKLIENQRETNKILIDLKEDRLKQSYVVIKELEEQTRILKEVQETQKEQLGKFQSLSFVTPPKAETSVN